VVRELPWELACGPCRRRHWGCLGWPCGRGGLGDIRHASARLGAPCL